MNPVSMSINFRQNNIQLIQEIIIIGIIVCEYQLNNYYDEIPGGQIIQAQL